MTSASEKYSQMSKTTSTTTRSFCPLILYHDKPSKQLSINLNVNKNNNRTAIDRHRDKTNEMLEHNAQLWTAATTDDEDYMDKDIKVSPSTSTTSNISSSSSSSGESIATIDHVHMRSPTIIHNYYNTTIIEEDYHHPSKMNQSKSPVAETITASSANKKRRRGNLPKEVTEFLRKWLIQHKKHPYPAEKEKADLARHTGLTVNQISNWFINARRRILQPMLESENLTAQMMAYPDMNTGNSSFNSNEPSRRRRHDFYTYQRDFNSNHIPDSSPPPMHPHHPMYYPSMEEERFAFGRNNRMMDHYDNNNQIPMR